MSKAEMREKSHYKTKGPQLLITVPQVDRSIINLKKTLHLMGDMNMNPMSPVGEIEEKLVKDQRQIAENIFYTYTHPKDTQGVRRLEEIAFAGGGIDEIAHEIKELRRKKSESLHQIHEIFGTKSPREQNPASQKVVKPLADLLNESIGAAYDESLQMQLMCETLLIGNESLSARSKKIKIIFMNDKKLSRN